jgi:hypothetical protein
MRQHPELAEQDDATLTLFADTLGVDVIRNWDGGLATSIADAWRIREHFDAEHQRQAEADAARLAALEAEDEIRFGAMRRREEARARRARLKAALEEIPLPDFDDERRRDWENKVDEYGRALFAKVDPPFEPFKPGDALAALKKKRGDK